jgi:hypothetical protein
LCSHKALIPAWFRLFLSSQDLEDRLIELEAMQKVIGEGVGQLTTSSMKLLDQF